MSSYENYVKFRDALGLKDIDVARKANVPPSSFTDWKKGKSAPKVVKMTKIADALGVSLNEIFGVEEIPQLNVPMFQPEHINLISLFDKLTTDEQNMVIQLMTTLICNRKE